MLIDHYKAIEKRSEEMLEAALAARWDRVSDCEVDCRRLIVQLRTRMARETLGPDDRVEKLEIMRRILLADAKVRRLAEPWQTDVECLLNGDCQRA